MNATEKYNGWTNYETWAVNLWMMNDEGSSLYWSEAAEAAYRDSTASEYLTREEAAVRSLADQIKSDIEENAPDLGSSLYADLLGAAMSEADWYEIAEHMISDLDKEAIDQE